MNKKLEQDLNLKDDCDDFIKPNDQKLNASDNSLIDQMVEVLAHERFNHDGWLGYGFYKKDACKFLLKLVRGEY